jgi:hypothetical protein
MLSCHPSQERPLYLPRPMTRTTFSPLWLLTALEVEAFGTEDKVLDVIET